MDDPKIRRPVLTVLFGFVYSLNTKTASHHSEQFPFRCPDVIVSQPDMQETTAMHTARQLRERDFTVTIAGEPSTREDLLSGWGAFDRLGVVVHEPFGGVGASHLIQLAITAYYDARPERRDGYPVAGNPYDPRAIYPEIYLFHVGGRWGCHSDYDFWPARKEVFLPTDARLVLDAVNDRAITFLAVPDRSVREVEHEFKEPAAARDRITQCWAYGALGRAANADVTIQGAPRRTEVNVNWTLDPVTSAKQAGERESLADDDLLARSYAFQRDARKFEAHDGLKAAKEARARLVVDGSATESYRRIGVDEALLSLVGPTHAPTSEGA